MPFSVFISDMFAIEVDFHCTAPKSFGIICARGCYSSNIMVNFVFYKIDHISILSAVGGLNSYYNTEYSIHNTVKNVNAPRRVSADAKECL